MIAFFNRQDYEQTDFYKKFASFLPSHEPSETEILQLIYNWLKIGIFYQKFDKIHFFHQISQSLYDVMPKK